jgi:hypothetical protein
MDKIIPFEPWRLEHAAELEGLDENAIVVAWLAANGVHMLPKDDPFYDQDVRVIRVPRKPQ